MKLAMKQITHSTWHPCYNSSRWPLAAPDEVNKASAGISVDDQLTEPLRSVIDVSIKGAIQSQLRHKVAKVKDTLKSKFFLSPSSSLAIDSSFNPMQEMRMKSTIGFSTEKEARDAGMRTYEELTAYGFDGTSWGTVLVPKREIEPLSFGGKSFFYPDDCNEVDVDSYAERMPFDLSLIPAELLELTARNYEAGEISDVLSAFDDSVKLQFVQANKQALKAVGMYETALVSAYQMGEFPHWRLAAIERLFREADPAKLRRAGTRMPKGRDFTVYRGVAGSGWQRHVSGMSWTRSLQKAKWFAKWNSRLGDPAVYRTRVKRENVYCYTNEREEEEFIFRAKWQKRMDIEIDITD